MGDRGAVQRCKCSLVEINMGCAAARTDKDVIDGPWEEEKGGQEGAQ